MLMYAIDTNDKNKRVEADWKIPRKKSYICPECSTKVIVVKDTTRGYVYFRHTEESPNCSYYNSFTYENSSDEIYESYKYEKLQMSNEEFKKHFIDTLKGASFISEIQSYEKDVYYIKRNFGKNIRFKFIEKEQSLSYLNLINKDTFLVLLDCNYGYMELNRNRCIYVKNGKCYLHVCNKELDIIDDVFNIIVDCDNFKYTIFDEVKDLGKF